MGYLRPDAIVRGSISWTSNGKPSGRIDVTVSLPDRFIELDYICNGTPITYRVQLESVPKHFGGCEWYFICPATGKPCRTLYGIGERFLSRSAYPDAMYRSQTESKSTREFLKPFKSYKSLREESNEKQIRKTYKGKLTKRYLRFLDRQVRLLNISDDPELFEMYQQIRTAQ